MTICPGSTHLGDLGWRYVTNILNALDTSEAEVQSRFGFAVEALYDERYQALDEFIQDGDFR